MEAQPLMAVAAVQPVQTAMITMNIQIPAGCAPGSQIQVTPPGQPPVMVTIPAGTSPGQTIQIQVPGSQPVAVMPACKIPGLEHLNMATGIFIKQKISMVEMFTAFEAANIYDVFDHAGNAIYQMGEESGCCMRQMCANVRPFKMVMQSAQQKFGETQGAGAVAVTFDRPYRFQNCPCYRQEISVYLGEQNAEAGNEPIGSVKQLCTVCASAFEVYVGGSVVYEIHGPVCVMDGPCCDVEFKITAPGDQENVQGMITKKSGGAMAQIFTDADNFSCEFPADCPIEGKIALMSGAILIDFCFFEKKAGDDGGGF